MLVIITIKNHKKVIKITIILKIQQKSQKKMQNKNYSLKKNPKKKLNQKIQTTKISKLKIILNKKY